MLSFYKALFKNPKSIGALFPSSKALARDIASHVSKEPDTSIVELGAGTGVIIQALLDTGINADRIIAIERSQAMLNTLRKKYPHITIIDGDASNLADLLKDAKYPVHTIICSLPLRLFDEALALKILQQAHSVLPNKGRYIQFTYNFKSNLIERLPHIRKLHSKHMWFNLPPARIDTYEITQPEDTAMTDDTYDTATFAAGCFWGVEATFREVPGVIDAIVGYTGGHTENPTYRQVCRKETGHAEAVEVTFDPEQVSYDDLLDVFFQCHTPTTLNRQGPDIGSQYRSAIFYHSDAQRAAAHSKIAALTEQGAFEDPIVTEVTEASTFYKAEEDHQRYFEKHGRVGCHFIPKKKE